MTDIGDYEDILDAIARGIETARNNPMPDETHDPDRYAAWCTLQELRRAGWTIRRNSN